MTAAAATNPTSSATQTNLAAGQTSLNTSYSTFLTLLTTQLKNQDPTSPLDTNAFTQQLVAMTGVQQQLLSNQLLQQIAGQTQDGGVASAVGKTVSATSAAATLSGGAANWTYNLASDAKAATLTISDSTGNAVWTGPAPASTAGAHAFSWNGKGTSGAQFADGGSYTLSVSAADGSGTAIASTLSVSGVVGSVTQSNVQTMVKVGATPVPLASITAVANQ
jgi:flagellar basal-body rod modification protein FlgD